MVRVILSWFAPFAFLLGIGATAYLTDMDLRYDTNDDAGMANILAGRVNGTTEGEPRLIFISPFVGSVLGALQSKIPSVDWYGLMHVGLCFMPLLLFSYMWIRNHENFMVVIAYTAFLLIFMLPIFSRMQFTKTSLILIFGGALSLIYYFGIQRLRYLALAILFFCFAFLIRDSSIGFTCVVIAALAGFYFFFNTETPFSRSRTIVVGAVVLSSVIVLHQAHKFAQRSMYFSEAEWTSFHEANSLRARIQHNYGSVSTLSRVIEDMRSEDEVAAAEYELILGWMMFSKDYYNPIRFTEIAQRFDQLRPDLSERLGAAVTSITYFIRHDPLFVSYLLASGCLVLLMFPTWGGARRTCYWLLVLMFAIFAITVLFRLPPYRAWMPMVLVISGIAATLNLFAGQFAARPGVIQGSTTNDMYWYQPSWIQVCVLLFLAIHGRGLFDYESGTMLRRFEANCHVTNNRLGRMQSLGEDARFFIVGAVVYSGCYAQPFRNATPDVISDQSVIFGWMNLTPWMQTLAFADGDESLIDEICDSDNSYLLVNQRGAERLSPYFNATNQPDEVVELPADPEWPTTKNKVFRQCRKKTG